MAFVSDKLYNGYLRKNMATIVSKVKPMEIMIHLPCLTPHDQEVIQAKTETRGKYDGMLCLLDCLRRRESWAEQFIDALEACEHRTIAAEIRAEYQALMGLDSSPGTVVTAHVHPAPSAPTPQPQETTAAPRAAEATPPEAALAEAPPPEAAPAEAPKAEPSPPEASPTEAPPPEASPTEAPPPEAALAEAPPPEASPPEAPAAVQTCPSVSFPERVLQPPQEAESECPPPPSPPPSPEPVGPQAGRQPEENSELEMEAEVASRVLRDGDTTSPPTQRLQIAVDEEDRPQPSPSPPQSLSEKNPVQETAPPIHKASPEVLQPGEQVVGHSLQTQTGPSSLPDGEPALQSDASICLSKPEQLVSVAPQTVPAQNQVHPVPNQVHPVQPYSGNSQRLEISLPPAGTEPVCQENGVASSQPEENHYHSSAEPEVLVNVLHVSEEPSILNLDRPTSATHVQINGQAADALLEPSSENGAATKTAPSPWDGEAPGTPLAPHHYTKYVLTAAGVGACALFMAWRMNKH